MSDTKKYVLGEDRIPKAWYNLAADLPSPPPAVLHPGTGQPIGPGDLAPLFPMAVIMQEVSAERWIEIPDPVRDIYRLWRPSPLIRAERLEKALEENEKLMHKAALKYEDLIAAKEDLTAALQARKQSRPKSAAVK